MTESNNTPRCKSCDIYCCNPNEREIIKETGNCITCGGDGMIAAVMRLKLAWRGFCGAYKDEFIRLSDRFWR